MKVQFLALHRIAPSSVPWEPHSPLDMKRPYGSQGKATPHEQHSWAGVKQHLAGSKRQELLLSLKLCGFGVSDVAP